MHRYAFVLAVPAVIACSTERQESVRTHAVWHREVDLTASGLDLAESAPGYVAEVARRLDLGLGPDDELAVTRTASGGGDLRYARLQQLHAGVAVHGAEVVALADDTTFLGVHGYLTADLAGSDVTPVLDSGAAMTIARDHHADGAALVTENEESALVILPGDDGQAALAWRVEFFHHQQAGLNPAQPVTFVDARSGSILRSFDSLATEQATGPGGNPDVPRSWLAELDVLPWGDDFAMQTDGFTTYDLAGVTYGDPEFPVIAPIDGFDDPAVNDAHGFAEVTRNMQRDWFGKWAAPYIAEPIISLVHYGDDFGHAFFNGTEVGYGDGDDRLYPLSGALDIVAHEIHHQLTYRSSRLEISGMSGALNDSFSDIGGTLAELYREGDAADFRIGEDIVKAPGAIRDLCDPPYDFMSIDHASRFARGMNPHFASGVPNKAFCLAVARVRARYGESTASAARRVGTVWYVANTMFWTSTATFTDGCQGVVDAARMVNNDLSTITALVQSWADVGVECGVLPELCDQNGTCDASRGETCANCPDDCDSCSEDCGRWKKSKCKLGVGDCSRCGIPEGCGDGVCAGDETDADCARDCGCAAPGATCGSVAPYGCWCDDRCEQNGDCCEDAGEVCS